MTLDEQTHFDAIEAALKVTVGDHVYDYGRVPGLDDNTGTIPAQFALLAVERRFVPASRMSAQTAVSGWRVLVEVVAANYPANVREGLADVASALNEQRLTIGDQQTTPIQHETSEAIVPDGKGWYSGRTFYTYAL